MEKQPALDATTLFEDLQDRHRGKFGNAKKRTFQRRVKAWKALHGPDKEVMFRQVQEPGRQGLSDFTDAQGRRGDDRRRVPGAPSLPLPARVSAAGATSRWCWAGSRSARLAEGLQEALWRLGGAPLEHRTDSLSAAYKNLSVEARE